METKNNSKKAVFTGVVAALAASSCCIPPVIAAIAGVGGAAGALSWMEPLRPYLIGLAVIAIGYAWYSHLKPKKDDDCGCEIEKPNFYQTKSFLVGITLFSTLSITFPYYSGIFYPDNKQKVIISDNSNIQKTTISIDGMTCDACQHHVNQVVNNLPGIVSVNSSYEKGNTEVAFDNTQTTIVEIEKAINSTGYNVTKID
ncbi:MAG: mercuric transport protein MerTP [Bacteroidetes bacterium]|nr:mercuric transport protein MerTP [Bacteroidota bacterium]